LTDVATLWAAKAPVAPEPVSTGKSYLMSYVLVGLCLALGLMAVCRPSSRGDKAKVRAKDEAVT
jgi:hypothetical protein